MKKIRTLVADDDPLCREVIAGFARRDAEIEIVGFCDDGHSTLEAIRTQRPDLVFLDMQMPRLSGVEVLKSLGPEERPAVIFVTGHHDYAVQAFELCAADYILKPFGDARFQSALSRAKEGIRRADLGELERRMEQRSARLGRLDRMEANEPIRAPADSAARVAFKVGGEYVLLHSDDIAWVEAKGDFVKLCGGGEVRQVRETLQSVEQRLDPRRFARVHRSFLVNVGCVRRIAPTVYGDHDLVMSDGVKIRLGRNYRSMLGALLPARDCLSG